MTPTPPPSSQPGYALRAAAFWARTHVTRRLRRKGFRGAFIFFGLVLPGLHLLWPDNVDLDPAAIVLGLVPLTALFASAGALRNEIEDQTLTYSFVRPMGRAWVFRALVFSAMVPVCLITLPCVFASTYHAGARILGAHVLAAVLATLSYTTVFALVGQFTKRATALGCVYLFFWEGMVSAVPGFLGKLTLVTHVRAVAGLPNKSLPLPLEMLDPATAFSSALTLFGVAVAALFLGGVIIQRREYSVSSD